MNITQIIESGLVRRYHTEPIPITQTNSQHQWGVAVILLHIIPIEYEHLTCDLIRAALLHDVPERVVGDMPAPFKWSNSTINKALDEFELKIATEMGVASYIYNLSEEGLALLKLADYLEAASFAYSIYRQGVQFGLQIFHNLYLQLQGRFDIDHNVAATVMLNDMLTLLQPLVSNEWGVAHPYVIPQA